MAIFILSFCLLSVVQLLHSGIDIDGRAERYRVSVFLARKHLGNLRTWARTPTNFFGSWAAQNVTFDDPEFPGYQVRVSVANQTVASPCTQLEAAFTPPLDVTDRRRLLSQCYYKAAVNVSWSPGEASSTIEIGSIIGAPTQIVKSVVTSPGPPGQLGLDGCFNFTATAFDAGGTAIPDVFFNWSQTPTTSKSSVGSFTNNGTRDGRQAQLQNYYCEKYMNLVPTKIYGGNGNVTIEPMVRASNSTTTTRTVEMQ